MSTLSEITNNAGAAATPEATLGGMGETTGTTTTAEPQTTAAAVAAAALKGQDEAQTPSEEVVSKPKTIEALIAERTAKRVQKKVAEQQLAEGHRRAVSISFMTLVPDF